MALQATFRKPTATRSILALVAVLLVTAACSATADMDAQVETVATERADDALAGAHPTSESLGYDHAQEPQVLEASGEEGSGGFRSIAAPVLDAKIIRDGRLDLRVEVGTFGAKAEELRTIAVDLGGYVASGSVYIEEHEDDRYAVGWYTMRIPSDRFDDAVSRVERLGERVSSSLSSHDVTEEYVDLEGRLSFWREQERFYMGLMGEATSIDDLIAIQTRMQEVLLSIERIEGRMRYLDSRTDFATLTVGLTEVPGGHAFGGDPGYADRIVEAFGRAGEVLIATVAFIIVSTAVAIPIGILVLFGYFAVRLLRSVPRRGEDPEE